MSPAMPGCSRMHTCDLAKGMARHSRLQAEGDAVRTGNGGRIDPSCSIRRRAGQFDNRHPFAFPVCHSVLIG